MLPVRDALASSVCGLAAGGGWGVADYFAAHGALSGALLTMGGVAVLPL